MHSITCFLLAVRTTFHAKRFHGSHRVGLGTAFGNGPEGAGSSDAFLAPLVDMVSSGHEPAEVRGSEARRGEGNSKTNWKTLKSTGREIRYQPKVFRLDHPSYSDSVSGASTTFGLILVLETSPFGKGREDPRSESIPKNRVPRAIQQIPLPYLP